MTLRLREGGLRIVVVADTHSRPHPKSRGLIAAERPDHILHAGDVGDLEVLDGLRKIAPVSAVRGNIDAHVPELPDTLTIDVCEGDEGVLKLLLLHIGVYGARVRGDVAGMARKEGARVVVCGHSHVPFIGRDRDLTVFNPGSMGPRRFSLPIVFGVIEIGGQGVTMRHVDCETGQRWLP
ncbi:MAG TPA: metallophosphoesterase family protein [Chloroflexota bacterium]|nr:metallophosphoesterase family protein [Chloroflexota bacterium]